jgi:hypothetical protein
MELNGTGSAFFGFAPNPDTPITAVIGKKLTCDGEAAYFNLTNSNGVIISYNVEKVWGLKFKVCSFKLLGY